MISSQQMIHLALLLSLVSGCSSTDKPASTDAALDQGSSDRSFVDLAPTVDLRADRSVAGDSTTQLDASKPKWSEIWAGTAYLDLWTTSTDLFGAGAGYDGTAWSAVVFTYTKAGSKLTALDQAATVTQLHGIGGNGSADVYAAGGPGLYHYDGQSWSPCARPAEMTSPWVVAGAGAGKVWVSSGYKLFLGDCSGLSESAAFAGEQIVSIASNSSYVYVGTTQAIHFISLPGGTWQKVTPPAGSAKFERLLLLQDTALALAKSSATSYVNTLLQGELGKPAMSEVFKARTGSALTGIAGTSKNDLYVSGSYNTLSHFNGSAWVDLPLPDAGTKIVHVTSMALLNGAPVLLAAFGGTTFDYRLYLSGN